MKREVDQVAETESNTFLDRGFLLESKTRGQEEIEKETEDIARGISRICRDNQIEQAIYPIMDGGRKESDEYKTNEFRGSESQI